jgi:ribosomal protein S18 acetylase RimI-like enzyme
MTGLELRLAAVLEDDALAQLFTASYADYLVPVTVTAEALRFMAAAYDFDREASLVAVRDDEPVGLVNLGVRGPDAWIGGLGVVPSERRRGTGRRLMEAVHEKARARSVERVWLEVIVENTQAVALYEQLGYTHVRELEVWSLAGAAGEAAECPAAEAHAWIREHRDEREPWQRADASLEIDDGTLGLLVDGAAAVVRVSGERVGVVQLAGRTAAALRELLSGARSLGETLGVLNLPANHLAGEALAELGGRVDVRQHEMVLAFTR